MNRCKCRVGKDGDLAELCIALGKAMHKQADRFLSTYDLTPSQFEILSVLSEGEPVPLNKLSERMCCACSNVTGLVDRLERDGLVKRERSQKDRRVILLELTDKGQGIWKNVPGNRCCGISFDGILNTEEKKEFRRVLEKLVTAMEG